jgi:hypothetical protein
MKGIDEERQQIRNLKTTDGSFPNRQVENACDCRGAMNVFSMFVLSKATLRNGIAYKLGDGKYTHTKILADRKLYCKIVKKNVAKKVLTKPLARLAASLAMALLMSEAETWNHTRMRRCVILFAFAFCPDFVCAVFSEHVCMLLGLSE